MDEENLCLRSRIGTGMPSKERFRYAPVGAYLERHPSMRNFPFRGGQQPKLREMNYGWVMEWWVAPFWFSVKMGLGVATRIFVLWILGTYPLPHRHGSRFDAGADRAVVVADS